MGKMPRKLLLAEDDERLGKTLEVEFRERHFEVHRIKSLKELSMFPKLESFNCAIVDLRLGADSGLELITTLREHSDQIRIVVLTGYGSIPTAVEAMKRGANQYLTKPAKVAAIEQALLKDSAEVAELIDERSTETLSQHERSFIDDILLQEDGNISRAAKRLGIHRQSLQRKLKKFTP